MIKLIAAGNRLMKDDGVGIAVAEHLHAMLKSLGIKVIICETDCHSCFYELERDDFLIILDAVYTESEPGDIKVYRLSDVLSQPSGNFAQHDAGITDLLKLYRSENRGYIIGIEISEVGYGSELSEPILRKFDDISSGVMKIINKILKEA